MVLPILKDFDFKGKKVLVRCDFDAPLESGMVVDDSRIRECLPTIKYLLENGAEEIILMGHLGRPLRQGFDGEHSRTAQGKLQGNAVEELSLKPVAQKLNELLSSKFKVQSLKLSIRRAQDPEFTEGQFKVQNFDAYQITEEVILLENLRFNPREEENNEEFAKELASLGDFYVNEAFASSHREHASIVGVPKFLPHCAGLHFASEVENLSKVLENPKRPLVFVMGGAKPETKMAYLENFARVADAVLVGGLLAEERYKDIKILSEKITFADLTESGLDISEESIKKFEEIIKSAGTMVWNGPMGKYEELGSEEGTRRIGETIANSNAFKVAGGGDTIAALKKFNLIDKMDYVSTAGGAMLEYLAKGSLPGIKALIS